MGAIRTRNLTLGITLAVLCAGCTSNQFQAEDVTPEDEPSSTGETP